jgi:hypothetical protein
MTAFADLLLLRFLDDAFVEDLLENRLGLNALFHLTYEPDDVELKDIALGSVQRRTFELPAFESVRTNGTDERLIPSADRVKVERIQPRKGRLAWIDVFLDVDLITKVHAKSMPIDQITSQNLLEKLGPVSSMAQLRAKLGALYPPSIVDAFLAQFRITTIAEFKRRPTLFLEFLFKAPTSFDPNDPANTRHFPLNICVLLQSDLQLGEALRVAKLCRNILENERDFVATFRGTDVETPFAFVVLFPDAAVSNGSLPNLTAAQIKTMTTDLFNSERMLARFV